MTDSTSARGRRAFAPTLLLGIPAAAVTVLAASKPMVSSPQLDGERYAALGVVPLSLPLAVLTLISWALLLALPGRWRRVPALFGLASSLAVIAAADAGLQVAQDDLVEAAVSLGPDTVQVTLTGWFWVLLVASVLAAIALGVALRHAHLWPTMSRRYEAPGSRTASATPRSDQDLWKALDEGRDPTVPGAGEDN